MRLATPAEQRHSLADAYRQHDSTFAARSEALVIQSAHVSIDGRQATSEASHNPDAPAHSSIDLNTASAQTLASLPGIGPSIAQRIIEYRDERGPFREAEELMNVKGIGPKKFERIKPYLSTVPARNNRTQS